MAYGMKVSDEQTDEDRGAGGSACTDWSGDQNGMRNRQSTHCRFSDCFVLGHEGGNEVSAAPNARSRGCAYPIFSRVYLHRLRPPRCLCEAGLAGWQTFVSLNAA